MSTPTPAAELPPLPQGLDRETIRKIIYALSDWSVACTVLAYEPALGMSTTGRGEHQLDWGLIDRILRGDCLLDMLKEAAARNGYPYAVLLHRRADETGWLPEALFTPVTNAVREYIATLAKEGHSVPPYYVDVQKSALLYRLLSGQHALPKAPPVSYSYPWYAVVEEPGPHRCELGGAVTLGALLQAEEAGQAACPRVTINQALWDVVAEEGDDLLVRWPTLATVYRVRKADDGSDAARFRPWLIEAEPVTAGEAA